MAKRARKPATAATATEGRGKKEVKATPARVPSHEEIARRAYEIYLSRGEVPGRDPEDWLQAEQELLAGLSSETAA